MHKWILISTDKQFASYFNDATIVRAHTSHGLEAYLRTSGYPPISHSYDMAWEFSDGVIITMYKTEDSGCDTCGHGGYEKEYYAMVREYPYLNGD